MKTLNELGKRFLQDKCALEERIEKLRSLQLPEMKKAGILAEAENMLQTLQEQYEKDLSAEQERLSRVAEDEQHEAAERACELQELSESLRDAKMEAANVDTRSVAEMTERERQELLTRHAETIQRMQRMQAEARLQRESIHQPPQR